MAEKLARAASIPNIVLCLIAIDVRDPCGHSPSLPPKWTHSAGEFIALAFWRVRPVTLRNADTRPIWRRIRKCKALHGIDHTADIQHIDPAVRTAGR